MLVKKTWGMTLLVKKTSEMLVKKTFYIEKHGSPIVVLPGVFKVLDDHQFMGQEISITFDLLVRSP